MCTLRVLPRDRGLLVSTFTLTWRPEQVHVRALLSRATLTRRRTSYEHKEGIGIAIGAVGRAKPRHAPRCSPGSRVGTTRAGATRRLTTCRRSTLKGTSSKKTSQKNTGCPPRRAVRRKRRPPPWTTLHRCNHPLEIQANTCPWDGVKTKTSDLSFCGHPKAPPCGGAN